MFSRIIDANTEDFQKTVELIYSGKVTLVRMAKIKG
jgi:hypothetical protein